MSTPHESDVPDLDPMTLDPANLGSVDPLSVEGLFLVALSKTGTERDAFLSGHCADSTQRQRVEALLVAYEQAGNFLQKPAIASEATPIGQYLSPCELPGTLGKLGPYEILEEIGRGGMGVVFRAHDPKLQRIVAVKALAPELARLPAARQRFLREARAAAAISHPHVVTIFAVEGTEEASLGTERTTLPYLVMECIVGQTLHDKIKRVGALKVEEIVRISRQIAEGLTAAHRRGLIHRDIKPANILLENGVERVRITDFGLARTTSDGGITHTGEILGTPQCMSPEQARGEIVDQRSDLFSLGCVMYTMCTGVSPFRADNMLAVMKKVCEETPRPIAQCNPEIPEWLGELVHRLLEKEPERRVQSASEVVEVLEARVMSNAPHVDLMPAIGSTTSFQKDVEPVPQWLLTPILPGLRRWLFKDRLLQVTLIAMLIGFLLGENLTSRILMLPIAGILGFGLLGLLQVLLKTSWKFINWKSMISVPLGMFLGGVCRAWLIFRSRSDAGWLEQMARDHAGWFVFPLAFVVFFLLNRYFPSLFIQNQKSVSTTFATPRATPTQVSLPSDATATTKSSGTLSPWTVLNWILVATLGLGIVSSLGFAVVLILPHLPPPGDLAPHATYVIRTPGAENLKYISIDGLQATLQPGGPGEWRIKTTPGTHNIYVSYNSDSMLNQERFFTVTASVERGQTTVVTAEPAQVRSLMRSPGVEAPVPGAAEMPQNSPKSASAERQVGIQTFPPVSAPSVPMGDAVEVLTDPKQMPDNTGGSWGSFKSKVRVWIDEPGLFISLRRLDFEVSEGSPLTYDSRNTWGEDSFREARTGKPAEIPPGRYQVLVQDLDYGWSVDQRGTILVGNPFQTVHVRRRFPELIADGYGFPLPFRWAGNSFEIDNADQVAAINGCLARLSERTHAPSSDVKQLFSGHALFDQIVKDDASGEWTLKYQPPRVVLKIEGNDTEVSFRHKLGSIRWSQSVPDGFHVPGAGISYQVNYRKFKWPNAQPASVQVDPFSDAPIVVPQLSRSVVREIVANTPLARSGNNSASLTWFSKYDHIYMSPDAVPVVRALVLAWLDGHPDVLESELLAVYNEFSGKTTTWENLWQYPGAGILLMTSILEPGKTPGSWRIKDPPEDALVD